MADHFRVKFGCVKIQDRGNQHDSVQVHPMPILQVTGQAGSPRCSITFADKEFGGTPAAIAGGIQADKIANRFDILL